MKKKKEQTIPLMKCNKCGKPPEINLEMSNANWTVYMMKCECGGRMVDIEENDEVANE